MPGETPGAGTPPTGNAIDVLRRPPFPPRDPALFMRAIYPDGPEEKTAPGPGLNAEQARALLAETLGRRAGLPAADASATVALFDDPALARSIPTPALRAALLLLRGTAGDAAIGTLMGGSLHRRQPGPVARLRCRQPGADRRSGRPRSDRVRRLDRR